MFVIGRTYPTLGGGLVTIVADNSASPCHKGYECVQGNDLDAETGKGIWRYNRQGDMGRVTGTSHTVPDPRNLVPPAVAG